jgi:hypothetical protein
MASILTSFSYREAVFSCIAMGNTKMALLWAQKAYDQHLRLGDEKNARFDDLSVIKQLEAILKTGKPVNLRQMEFTEFYL